MAKTGKRVRDLRRRVVVQRFQPRQAELEAVIASRPGAAAPVSAPPRRGCHGRRVTRPGPGYVTATRSTAAPAVTCGRSGVSRIRFRQLAHDGELPGVTKASW